MLSLPQIFLRDPSLVKNTAPVLDREEWLNPGSVVAERFVILKELGKGGMGVVCLAEDTRLDMDVALKFISPRFQLNQKAAQLMRRETLRSLKLTHSNLVRVHDFHLPDDAPPFIAMEYVKGLTAKELARKQPGSVLRWPWVATITLQVCDALSHAHSQNIAHRDIKPANILLGYDGRIKLSDFGVSAHVSSAVTPMGAELSGAGTPAFMSPQQMWGDEACLADDVYSLGATLYALLTGRPPFYRGDIGFQVWHEAPQNIPDRLRELGTINDIPAHVVQVVMQCLEKEKEDRPASIDRVRSALKLDEVAPENLNLSKDGS